MRYRCPHCGGRFELHPPKLALTERQREILLAIDELRRSLNGRSGRGVSSRTIATRTGWGIRTVQYELAYLEVAGEVTRVGVKRGWLVAQPQLGLFPV
jgi:hypothetical protein